MKQTARRLHVFFICLAFALATIIAFVPVRHNDFISYDDYAYVAENEQVRGGITRESIVWAFTTSYKANWHPLTWLSHMLDCDLFELNPVWHHLVNLLFHIANALLLFWVFKRMTGKVWLSGFVAAAFALHPLHVESVVWVAERKDILSGFFWMLTMCAYVKYAERPYAGRYLLVVLALGLGLMAKPMLVTLPFVLLLLDYWPLGRFRWGRQSEGGAFPQPKSTGPVRDPKEKGSNGAGITYQESSAWRLVGEKIPLFILVAVSSVVTIIAQQTGGAVLPMRRLPLSFRAANAFTSYVIYIRKMFYPGRLAIFYPHRLHRFLSWQPIVCLMILILVSAVIIYTVQRRRYLVVGWLWYLGTLFPVIGLVQVGSQAMADRYTYLPSIGIFIMAAWGAVELLSKLRYRSIWLGILSGLLLAAMVFCTRMQVQRWKNNLTLYQHTLAVTENNSIILNSYGCALFEEEQLDEAITQLKEALRISPKFSLARSNLGRVFLKQGKLSEAIVCFNEVLRLNRDCADVHFYLGLAKVRQEKLDDAITHFTEALRLKQDYISARLHLAYTLVKLDRVRQAVEHFYKILQLKPDHLAALNGVAWVLATRNDMETQEPIKAVEFAERACELTNYQNAGAMDTLAAAYAVAGKFSLAVETAEKALKLATSANDKKLTLEIQKRLQLYRAGQPYIDKRP